MPKAETRHKAPTSRLLVIDASVLRASGGEGAVDPVPANCRDLLKRILDICHRAAVTSPLLDEWNRHQSRYARQWRTAMYARGKIKPVEPVKNVEVARALAEAPYLTSNEREAGAKDLHLLETARAAERTIISGDDAALAVFRKLIQTTRADAGILWINPVTDFARLRDWLGLGGTARSDWRLGFQQPITPRRRNIRATP